MWATPIAADYTGTARDAYHPVPSAKITTLCPAADPTDHAQLLLLRYLAVDRVELSADGKVTS
ncbi:MAG TPA: hypothetical protein VIC62_12640 [Nakamurella sp.]